MFPFTLTFKPVRYFKDILRLFKHLLFIRCLEDIKALFLRDSFRLGNLKIC